MSPTVLEPGQVLAVPVTIKLGLGSGEVFHLAALEVEGDDDAVNLYTTATAKARATVDELEPPTGAVEIGQAGHGEYLIRSFGTAADPPRELDDSAIQCELPTHWVGPAMTETDGANPLLMIHRRLALTLPATHEPGRRRAELSVLGVGGSIIGRRQVVWEVITALTASPAGLVFGAVATAGAEQRLQTVIRSRDKRPFRITATTTDVAGLVITGIDGEQPRSLHTIACILTPAGETAKRTGMVLVRTDHPLQAEIRLAVYIPASAPVPLSSDPSRSAP